MAVRADATEVFIESDAGEQSTVPLEATADNEQAALLELDQRSVLIDCVILKNFR